MLTLAIPPLLIPSEFKTAFIVLVSLNKRTFFSPLQLESRLYFVENDTKYSDVAPLMVTEHFPCRVTVDHD